MASDELIRAALESDEAFIKHFQGYSRKNYHIAVKEE